MSARLRELTLTDELTGLRNRRGFVVVGSQMLEVADHQLCAAFLLFLDIDNLKELNDDRGHSAGDAALTAVARALGEVLRRADAASRIGGDEFVALALGWTNPTAPPSSSESRTTVRGADRCCSGRGVEVSMGWAARAPGESKTVEDLLVEADRAMYRSEGC